MFLSLEQLQTQITDFPLLRKKKIKNIEYGDKNIKHKKVINIDLNKKNNFRQNYYDTILFFNIMEHLSNFVNAKKEIKK